MSSTRRSSDNCGSSTTQQSKMEEITETPYPVRETASDEMQEQLDEEQEQKSLEQQRPENRTLPTTHQIREKELRQHMPNPLAKEPPKRVPESPPKHVPSKYQFDVSREAEENRALTIDLPRQWGEEDERERSITYTVRPRRPPTQRLDNRPFRDDEDTFDDRIYLTKNRLKVAERKVSVWKSMWHIMRNLRFGPDLRSLICPPELLKPMSNLEMFAVYSQPRNYLMKMTEYQSSLLRMQACVKWLLEAIVVIYRPQGLSHAKPLNPIRGEIFRCEWRHSDKSITTCIVECVNHEPEIDALFFENKTHNIVYEATIRPVLKRTKSFLRCKILGEGRLHLLKTGEVYEIVFPCIDVRNVFLGKSYICPHGDVEILCEQTKLRTLLHIDSSTFKIRGKIVGDFREGIICKISGNLQMDVHIKDFIAKKKAQILNPARIREVPMKVARLSQQADLESRRVWYSVCYALVKNQMNDAQKAKNRIEERQKLIRANEPPTFQWRPKYFTVLPDDVVNDELELPFYRHNRFYRPLMHQDELSIPWTGPITKNDKLRRNVEVNPLMFAEDDNLLRVLDEGPVLHLEELNRPDQIDILERESEDDTESANRAQQEEMIALEREPFTLSDGDATLSMSSTTESNRTPEMSPGSEDSMWRRSSSSKLARLSWSSGNFIVVPRLRAKRPHSAGTYSSTYTSTPTSSEVTPMTGMLQGIPPQTYHVLVANEDGIVKELG